MFPSYRNQSVDLQSKSTDWFLYDGTLVVKRLILEVKFVDDPLRIVVNASLVPECAYQGVRNFASVLN